MATGLIEIMKRASKDLMDNEQLADLRFGTVISVSPLKIQVTPQFIITSGFLIVPEKLTDYKLDVTIEWNTEEHTHSHSIYDTWSGGGSCSSETHKHEVVGKKSIIIHNALKVGDKVALLRKSGGQSFYILDRI